MNTRNTKTILIIDIDDGIEEELFEHLLKTLVDSYDPDKVKHLFVIFTNVNKKKYITKIRNINADDRHKLGFKILEKNNPKSSKILKEQFETKFFFSWIATEKQDQSERIVYKVKKIEGGPYLNVYPIEEYESLLSTLQDIIKTDPDIPSPHDVLYDFFHNDL